MTLSEIVHARKSVRSYDADRSLSESDVAMLLNALEESKSPFGGHAVVELKKFSLDGPFRPSTYGTITGAQWYFLMGTDSSEAAQLTLGFRMEQVVLKATEMGLGTCWIAATFKGTSFASAAKFPAEIPLQVIMPVGYPADKKSLLERLTRTALRSAARKPMSDLFFDSDFDTPVPEGDIFYEPLEMMRLAPSSTNSQPWRALVQGNSVFFYYVKKSEASILDLGIGLAHFYLALRERGIEGEFSICRNAPSPGKWIPLVKYRLK